MTINAVNSNYVSFGKDAEYSNKTSIDTNTSLLQQNTAQDSFTMTNMEDPKVLDSIGKGIVLNVEQFVPFLGTHEVGDLTNKREAVMNEFKNPDGYDINNDEKGIVSTFGKGLLAKLSYAIPIYGTYKLGKEAIETERAYDAVINGEAPSTEKPGFFKCLGKGIGKSIALAIPGLSTYVKGKDVEMINQLYDEIKAQETYYEEYKLEHFEA